jgi:hypothetical protein
MYIVQLLLGFLLIFWLSFLEMARFASPRRFCTIPIGFGFGLAGFYPSYFIFMLTSSYWMRLCAFLLVICNDTLFSNLKLNTYKYCQCQCQCQSAGHTFFVLSILRGGWFMSVVYTVKTAVAHINTDTITNPPQHSASSLPPSADTQRNQMPEF